MHRDQKKALYLGKITDEIEKITDAAIAKPSSVGEWNIDLCNRNDLFFKENKGYLYDLFLCDLSHESFGKLEHLHLLKKRYPKVPIMVVAHQFDAQFVRVMTSGVVDDGIHIHQSPMEYFAMMTACHERANERSRHAGSGDIFSNNDVFRGAGETLEKIASRIPQIHQSAIRCVHIVGETGTGKEIVAQLFRSIAGDSPFYVINCASISAPQLEQFLRDTLEPVSKIVSEPKKDHEALISRGWIFLDEVASLNYQEQGLLLRYIESEDVGEWIEQSSHPWKFRFISTTGKSLRELARSGAFRWDLYTRLIETEIRIPPLRDRKDEIPFIIDALIKALPGGPFRISTIAKSILADYPWSDGNVRQLRNCLRAMTEFHVEGFLTPQSIPSWVLENIHIEYPKNQFNWQNLMEGNHQKRAFCSNDVQAVRVRIPRAKKIDFHRMTLELFVELAKSRGVKNGRISTRLLADTLGVSKSTVARKLKEASDLGVGDVGHVDVSR